MKLNLVKLICKKDSNNMLNICLIWVVRKEEYEIKNFSHKIEFSKFNMLWYWNFSLIYVLIVILKEWWFLSKFLKLKVKIKDGKSWNLILVNLLCQKR